ncbi:hypothetical protein [Flavobacterium sp. 2]|uniref:hypothetical protein n=1 Tax=Flavobacterium sp. 2 TaxID=308053 RepID=UPI003CF5323D
MDRIKGWFRGVTERENVKKVSDIDFKDENFKRMISDLKIDSLMKVTELNCEDFNLVSIDEIKYFPNLEILTINSFDLEELNLGFNHKLKVINIKNSEHLTEIDFSKNTSLEVLELENLLLENLDLKANINLKKIVLDSLNEMDDIDLTYNLNLEELYVTHMLNFNARLNEKNKVLKKVYCSYGGSCKWEQSGLPALEDLTLENAEIDSVDVTGLPKLKKLDITWNQISEINLFNNILLEELRIGDNAFSNINLEKNINLKYLHLGGDYDRWSYEKINHTFLDVTHNTKLIQLFINSSGLSELDLSQNLFLERLYIDENPIKSLDLSKNYLLNDLSVQNTILEAINLSGNIKLKDVQLKDNKLSLIQFPVEMDIKQVSLSKDMFDDETIQKLVAEGFVFEKD